MPETLLADIESRGEVRMVLTSAGRPAFGYAAVDRCGWMPTLAPWSGSGDWDPPAETGIGDQRTRMPGPARTLGSTNLKEGAMSVVVGIDVGAYKHAAAVCRNDRREAERRVFRYRSNRAFGELDVWLQSH